MIINETAGILPTAARNERPQFFARMALVMAAIVVFSFPVTCFYPVVTGSGKFHALHHVHGLAESAKSGQSGMSSAPVVGMKSLVDEITSARFWPT